MVRGRACMRSKQALERSRRRHRRRAALPALRTEPDDGAPRAPTRREYLIAKYGMSARADGANHATHPERGAAVGFTFGERAARLEHLRRAPAAALGRPRGPRTAARAEAGAAEGLPRRGAQPRRARRAARAGRRRRPGRRARARGARQRTSSPTRCAKPSGSGTGRHPLGAGGRDQPTPPVSGGQPAEVFEQALRQIAAEV